MGFVVFEKVHGLLSNPVNTSAETKIAAGCALVKAAAAAAGTQARQSPITHQNGATSGFEMCFCYRIPAPLVLVVPTKTCPDPA